MSQKISKIMRSLFKISNIWLLRIMNGLLYTKSLKRHVKPEYLKDEKNNKFIDNNYEKAVK